MKIKKGDRVEYIGDTIHCFTKGKIYTINSDGLGKYGHLCIEEDDLGEENGWKPEYFKLIEENKMKTSKEMQLKILDKMKSNIDNNLPMCSGIEYYSYRTQKWHTPEAIDFENLEYRLKPETITLKNGVTIPKPLSIDELQEGTLYHFPTLTKYLYDSCYRDWLIENEVAFAYATKEQAIEASKKLFGIE